MCEATGRRGWGMGRFQEGERGVIDEADVEAEVGVEDELYLYTYVDPM